MNEDEGPEHWVPPEQVLRGIQREEEGEAPVPANEQWLHVIDEAMETVNGYFEKGEIWRAVLLSYKLATSYRLRRYKLHASTYNPQPTSDKRQARASSGR